MTDCRAVYLRGPEGELVTLQRPDPETVAAWTGEKGYELLTRERFNELAASRLDMERE